MVNSSSDVGVGASFGMDIGDMSWRSMSAIVDKLALASEEPVPAEALDWEAG